MSKRERLQVSRQRAKLEKNLGSISDLTRIPSAIFIVDVLKENIALAEARKLGIPVFAMVDTNSDPRPVDFPIPANDDASRSIALVLDILVQAVAEGLQDRKADKDQADALVEAKKAKAEAAKSEVAEAAAEDASAASDPAPEAPAEEAKSDEKSDEKEA
jgi:small subunit ribosomal protein S2